MAYRVIRTALLLMGVAGLTAAACSDETEGETDGSGGDGAGGATTTTPTTAGGTGGTPDIPIECPSGDYTTIPTVGECDLLQNDCPPGFGCEPVTDGDWTTGCVAGNGLKGPGQPCVSAGDCKPGSECVFDVCAPVCCPDNDEPCEGGLCNVVNQFGDYLVRYCSYLAQCDLFDPNQCDDGVLGNCYPSGMGYAICAPASATQVGDGEACENLNDCLTNMWCSGGTTCRYTCLIDGSSTVAGEGGCPAGQTCNPNPQFGIDGVGLC